MDAPKTLEEAWESFYEWVDEQRELGLIRDVRLFGETAPKPKEGIFDFPMDANLRKKILREYVLERLDTLSMLDVVTFKFKESERWFNLGILDLLTDDNVWRMLWKRDFADQVPEIWREGRQNLPRWVTHNTGFANPAALSWRRYWIWTWFFRRTLCKMVLTQLNQRDGTTYEMMSRSDHLLFLRDEDRHGDNPIPDTDVMSIWDLEPIVRPGLDEYFEGLASGRVMHGVPIVCGSMLRYFLLTNGKTDEQLKSEAFVQLWTGTEHQEIPVDLFRLEGVVNSNLWSFGAGARPSNLPNRYTTAIQYATWYWQEFLLVHAPVPLTPRVPRTDFNALRHREESENRSRKRIRETLWFYYFNFRYRKFRGAIQRSETDEFALRGTFRGNQALNSLYLLPDLPRTTDVDSRKIFLGSEMTDSISCAACGGSSPSYRCKYCKTMYYCSTPCHREHACKCSH